MVNSKKKRDSVLITDVNNAPPFKHFIFGI